MRSQTSPPILLLALLALVATGASSQGLEESGMSTTVDVSLIEIEVRVEDKDGEFVSGLGPRDFAVKQDGAPVVIRFVDELQSGVRRRADGSVPAQALAAEPVAPEATKEKIPSTLLIVIDGTNSGASAIARQRSYIKNFLRSLPGANVQSAVFVLRADGSFDMISPFQAPLEAALNAVAEVKMGSSGGSDRRLKLGQMESLMEQRLSSCTVSGGGGSQQLCLDSAFETVVNNARIYAQEEQARAGQTMASLRAILSFSDHLPGRRSLVLVSEGIDPGGASYFNAAAKLIRYHAQNQGAGGWEAWVAAVQREATRFMSQLPELGKLPELAVSSAITVHWINPSHQGELSDFDVDAGGGSYSVGADFVNVADRIGMMKDLAEETGGIARLRAADIEGFYRRVEDDLRRYYLISFVPSRAASSGGVHDIEVDVDRKNTRVRSRRRYHDLKTEQRRMRRLAAVLDFPEVFNSLPLTAQLTYLKGADGYDVTMRMAIPYAEISPRIEGDRATSVLQYGFAVRDAKGKPVRTKQPAMRLSLPLESFNELVEAGAEMDYRHVLQLPAGDYSVTAAILDEASDRASARRFVVKLPAPGEGCLKAAPLMLASHVRNLDEAVATLEIDEQGDISYKNVKLSFSAVRAMAPKGQLSGLYQLFNSEADAESRPQVEASFRLRRGRDVVNQTVAHRVTRYDANGRGTVTNFFSVPYSGLPPGAYRLELVARDQISGCTTVSGADFWVETVTASAQGGGDAGRN